MIKRINVEYSLRVDANVDREKVQRAFDAHMPKCPVYRSIGAAIEIKTSLKTLEG